MKNYVPYRLYVGLHKKEFSAIWYLKLSTKRSKPSTTETGLPIAHGQIIWLSHCVANVAKAKRPNVHLFSFVFPSVPVSTDDPQCHTVQYLYPPHNTLHHYITGSRLIKRGITFFLNLLRPRDLPKQIQRFRQLRRSRLRHPLLILLLILSDVLWWSVSGTLMIVCSKYRLYTVFVFQAQTVQCVCVPSIDCTMCLCSEHRLYNEFVFRAWTVQCVCVPSIDCTMCLCSEHGQYNVFVFRAKTVKRVCVPNIDCTVFVIYRKLPLSIGN
jgi:hypothetical protein